MSAPLLSAAALPLRAIAVFGWYVVGIITVRNPVAVIVPKPLVRVGAEEDMENILDDSSQHDMPPLRQD